MTLPSNITQPVFSSADRLHADIMYDHPEYGVIPMTVNEVEYPDIWEVVAANAADYVVPPEPEPPTVEELRAGMVISPLQGILTLGETEWGKVLAYRDTATWEEQIVINNASDWVRTSENIAFFGYLLDYAPEQMDALFIAAAQVTA